MLTTLNRRFLLTGGLAAMTTPALAEPLRRGNAGRAVVSVTVNRRVLDMIVDTGASNTCLSETAFARLGLTPERVVRMASPQGPRETPLVRLHSVQALGGSCGDLSALVLPDTMTRGHDGLLGADAFRAGKLVMDFTGAGDLSLDPSGPTPGLASVQGSVGGNGILFVHIGVGAGEVLAMADTGASDVFVNRPFLAWAGSAEGEPVVMSLGERSLRVRPSVSSMANWGDQPGVLLGMALWQRLGAVAFDFPAAQLHLPR